MRFDLSIRQGWALFMFSLALVLGVITALAGGCGQSVGPEPEATCGLSCMLENLPDAGVAQRCYRSLPECQTARRECNGSLREQGPYFEPLRCGPCCAGGQCYTH